MRSNTSPKHSIRSRICGEVHCLQYLWLRAVIAKLVPQHCRDLLCNKIRSQFRQSSSILILYHCACLWHNVCQHFSWYRFEWGIRRECVWAVIKQIGIMSQTFTYLFYTTTKNRQNHSTPVGLEAWSFLPLLHYVFVVTGCHFFFDCMLGTYLHADKLTNPIQSNPIQQW